MNRRLIYWGAFIVSAMALLPDPASGLARWPDSNTALPGNIANNIVTIYSVEGAGTGTVLRKVDSGAGAWLCLLTADHVTRGSLSFTIGFNNGFSVSYFSPSLYSDWFLFLGPTINGGLVDLSVMSLFVPNRNLLPALDTIALGGAAAGDTGTLAGYGNTNIAQSLIIPSDKLNDPPIIIPAPGPARSYQVVPEFGTFRTGTDIIDNVNTPYTRGIYSFRAIQGFLDFAPAAGWPPATGSAYTLSGDSGGPTFVGNALVGVHSGSQGRVSNGIEYIDEGFRWTDVDMGVQAHRDWVQGICMVVPEPTSIVILLSGSAGLLITLVRRRS